MSGGHARGVPPPSPEPAAWQLPRPVAALDLAEVRIEDHDGITIASVSGEVDMSSVDRIAAALSDLSNLALGLIVDLRAVEYLDSSGISLLHDLALRLRQRTQLLIIVCPPGSPPRRMLELTALDAHAAVLDGLDAAIHAVQSAYADEPAAGTRG